MTFSFVLRSFTISPVFVRHGKCGIVFSSTEDMINAFYAASSIVQVSFQDANHPWQLFLAETVLLEKYDSLEEWLGGSVTSTPAGSRFPTFPCREPWWTAVGVT